jgi:hypothetical protein
MPNPPLLDRMLALLRTPAAAPSLFAVLARAEFLAGLTTFAEAAQHLGGSDEWRAFVFGTADYLTLDQTRAALNLWLPLAERETTAVGRLVRRLCSLSQADEALRMIHGGGHDDRCRLRLLGDVSDLLPVAHRDGAQAWTRAYVARSLATDNSELPRHAQTSLTSMALAALPILEQTERASLVATIVASLESRKISPTELGAVLAAAGELAGALRQIPSLDEPYSRAIALHHMAAALPHDLPVAERERFADARLQLAALPASSQPHAIWRWQVFDDPIPATRLAQARVLAGLGTTAERLCNASKLTRHNGGDDLAAAWSGLGSLTPCHQLGALVQCFDQLEPNACADAEQLVDDLIRQWSTISRDPDHGAARDLWRPLRHCSDPSATWATLAVFSEPRRVVFIERARAARGAELPRPPADIDACDAMLDADPERTSNSCGPLILAAARHARRWPQALGRRLPGDQRAALFDHVHELPSTLSGASVRSYLLDLDELAPEQAGPRLRALWQRVDEYADDPRLQLELAGSFIDTAMRPEALPRSIELATQLHAPVVWLTRNLDDQISEALLSRLWDAAKAMTLTYEIGNCLSLIAIASAQPQRARRLDAVFDHFARDFETDAHEEAPFELVAPHFSASLARRGLAIARAADDVWQWDREASMLALIDRLVELGELSDAAELEPLLVELRPFRRLEGILDLWPRLASPAEPRIAALVLETIGEVLAHHDCSADTLTVMAHLARRLPEPFAGSITDALITYLRGSDDVADWYALGPILVELGQRSFLAELAARMSDQEPVIAVKDALDLAAGLRVTNHRSLAQPFVDTAVRCLESLDWNQHRVELLEGWDALELFVDDRALVVHALERALAAIEANASTLHRSQLLEIIEQLAWMDCLVLEPVQRDELIRATLVR